MANPYVYDINTYVKADSTITTLAGGVIPIHPLVGYETDTSPFMLYWWMPGIYTRSLYFARVDQLRYHILDTDADRGFKIQEALMARLNKGDLIQGQIASTNARILWSFQQLTTAGQFNAVLGAPGEREGFYEFQSIFEIGYVPLA